MYSYDSYVLHYIIHYFRGKSTVFPIFKDNKYNPPSPTLYIYLVCVLSQSVTYYEAEHHNLKVSTQEKKTFYGKKKEQKERKAQVH